MAQQAGFIQHSQKRLQFRTYNVLILIAMGFGSMSFGYNVNVISTTLAQPTFIEYFELATRSNATALIGSMNGLFQTAAFLNNFTFGFIADKWGRKVAIVIAAVLTILGGALCAGSVNIGMFIFFRFVSGAGAGLMLAAVPTWMNEVVPAKNRGGLVDIHGALFNFGFMAASWVGYGFYFLTPHSSSAWRGPLGFQCLPPVILLAFIHWLPESPRWLLMNNKRDEARNVLLRLHTEEEAAIELVEIQAQMQIDRTLDKGYWHIFKKPSYRKRALLAMLTGASVQFSGVLVINNYGPTIYKSLGFSSEKQLLIQSIWGTVGVIAGAVAITFVDLLPRARLLGYGLIGCIICLIIECALVANYAEAGTNHPALRAAVAVIFLYVVIYEATLDGTQFVYFGELFPSHIRAKGFTLGVGAITLMNVIFLQAAPTAFKTIGWKYYILFIVLSAVSATIILLFFPDLRRMPLEEISALFGDDDELYHGLERGGAEVIENEKSDVGDKSTYETSVEQADAPPK